MLRNVKRPYKKLYDASPLTHIVNLDGHREGDEIQPGTIVTVIAHYGPFRRIEDEHGNRMSVGRHSLVPVRSKGYAQPAPGTLIRDDGKVQAKRFTKRDGANFSGWVVSEYMDRHAYSDPIPTKSEAIDVLLGWVVEDRS